MSKHILSWCMIGWLVHALKITWIWHGKCILIVSCEYWLASCLVSSLQSIEFLFKLIRYESYTCCITLLDRCWWLSKFIRSHFILTIMITCYGYQIENRVGSWMAWGWTDENFEVLCSRCCVRREPGLCLIAIVWITWPCVAYSAEFIIKCLNV